MNDRRAEAQSAVLEEVRATGPISLGDIAQHLSADIPRRDVLRAAFEATENGQLVQDFRGRLHSRDDNSR